jgi:hypothetical protein
MSEPRRVFPSQQLHHRYTSSPSETDRSIKGR